VSRVSFVSRRIRVGERRGEERERRRKRETERQRQRETHRETHRERKEPIPCVLSLPHSIAALKPYCSEMRVTELEETFL
jgi:hypothetical protein